MFQFAPWNIRQGRFVLSTPMETSVVLVKSLLETVDQGLFTDPSGTKEVERTKVKSQSGKCRSVLADESFPRGQWLLAQVIEVFRSGDGFVRSATVKTS